MILYYILALYAFLDGCNNIRKRLMKPVITVVGNTWHKGKVRVK